MKTHPRIVIVGASGHGLVALEAAIAQGYDVAGFVDSFKPTGMSVLGHDIIGTVDQMPALISRFGVDAGFLAISNNVTRAAVAAQIERMVPGFCFVSVCHPAAWISPSAKIGAGALVMTAAVVHAGCVVGDHAIINTRVSLDHESTVAPFASLLPGVTTGGNVTVGERSCVCIGTTIAHKISIGRDTVVGAGSVVLRNIPDLVLAFGVPARIVRPRTQAERHF